MNFSFSSIPRNRWMQAHITFKRTQGLRSLLALLLLLLLSSFFLLQQASMPQIIMQYRVQTVFFLLMKLSIANQYHVSLVYNPVVIQAVFISPVLPHWLASGT